MDVTFYSSTVKNSLFALEKSTISKALKQIQLLKSFGNKLGMPYSKRIGKNLFELRVHGQQEARLLYFYHQQHVVIIHIFIKKTQKTPRKEIDLATKRIRDLCPWQNITYLVYFFLWTNINLLALNQF